MALRTASRRSRSFKALLADNLHLICAQRGELLGRVAIGDVLDVDANDRYFVTLVK
jgi:hypothetical protein